MLFSRKHAWQIVEGRRTVLFDVKQPKREIGRTYAVQVRPSVKNAKPEAPLCRVSIESVTVVSLGELIDADAIAAGYSSLAAFKERWQLAGHEWVPDRLVYRTQFRLVGPAIVKDAAA